MWRQATNWRWEEVALFLAVTFSSPEKNSFGDPAAPTHSAHEPNAISRVRKLRIVVPATHIDSPDSEDARVSQLRCF
jgi:hypothetical protein